MGKNDALRDDGTINARADAVTDPKFMVGGFFDPRDVVQVKYEMLRRTRVDEVSVTRAVEEAGFSRQTFYKAKSDFEEAGIVGLVPKKRGPRGPHKLRGDVLDFMKASHSPGQPIRARVLAGEIEERFGVRVHPRSIERALGDTQKNTK
jgi:transposase